MMNCIFSGKKKKMAGGLWSRTCRCEPLYNRWSVEHSDLLKSSLLIELLRSRCSDDRFLSDYGQFEVIS
jgi:hypothetical protein